MMKDFRKLLDSNDKDFALAIGIGVVGFLRGFGGDIADQWAMSPFHHKSSLDDGVAASCKSAIKSYLIDDDD